MGVEGHCKAPLGLDVRRRCRSERLWSSTPDLLVQRIVRTKKEIRRRVVTGSTQSHPKSAYKPLSPNHSERTIQLALIRRKYPPQRHSEVFGCWSPRASPHCPSRRHECVSPLDCRPHKAQRHAGIQPKERARHRENTKTLRQKMVVTIWWYAFVADGVACVGSMQGRLAIALAVAGLAWNRR